MNHSDRSPGQGWRLAVAALCLVAAAGTTAQEVVSRPFRLSQDYAPGDSFMGVRLLGTRDLAPVKRNNQTLMGLSALGWDADEGLLYALSDRGVVFHLRPVLEDDRLADVEVVNAFPLLDGRGRPLKGPWADSEGLDVARGRNGRRGDSRLVVSFERRPRVLTFTPDGGYVDNQPIPPELRSPRTYAHGNRALESVALHVTAGLLTAPELPLRDGEPFHIPVFAERETRWAYPRWDPAHGGLVAVEALPDGSLVMLERSLDLSYIVPTVTIALRLAEAPADGKTAALKVHDLALLSSTEGWAVDNFEGLARHEGRRFFMVSDDNGSRLQRTLLVYLEVVATDAESLAARPRPPAHLPPAE